MKKENTSVKADNKAFKKKFATWFWCIMGTGIAAIVLVFWMITKGWLGYLPPLDELQNPKNKYATEVISSDMQLLGRYYRNENRVSVEYTDISPNMIHALIATEDVRFYDHTGVDVKSLMRAILKLGKAGGGSTLTQQLAKQLWSPRANNIFERALQKPIEWVLDLPSTYFDIVTLSGSWIKEAHAHATPVSEGIYVNSSTVGASSNRHNPAFMLVGKGADYDRGNVYGFNLVYSGNHYSAIEGSPAGTTRVMSGINPHCFNWVIGPRESFETPQAIMTYSAKGINKMAQNMHSFVNNNIVRGMHKGAERPIVINNWEAMMFDFTKQKIVTLADKAKKLGVEMLVLDDGWFGARNHDKAGLGDWVVNTKKLPGGLTSLAKAINNRGMKFGLWFEPECVNPDSDLYRAHPDWAIAVPSRTPSLGRNQMVLDLTRKEVRDYIVDAVDAILNSANIEYVKWDYNRHISDMYSVKLQNQGEFYHRYIIGLYEVLDRIFHQKHPNILFESCSSGGNRFDLGMLCYSPQIWTSDDTDPIERLDIQGGIFNFYPPSCVSAHVSMSPNAQTLRNTPISTRFNVASFGVLGYELDFAELTPDELKQVKEQIEFYKAHRKTFQYGKFEFVHVDNPNQLSWQISSDGEIIAGLFQKKTCAFPYRDRLVIPSANPDKQYSVECVKQYLRVKTFGTLIHHILPVRLKTDGIILRTADKHYSLTDGHETYTCYGDILNFGMNLEMQYEGTGYNEKIRLLGDFGSNLYLIKEI